MTALGYIVHEGPSRLDGEPIAAILLTGRASANRKTGPMLQTYILRADMPPTEAARAGADVSVCGDCALRSNGCYVYLGHGPTVVWRAYQAGRYARLTDAPAALLAALTHSRTLRLGTYGDPAAIPTRIWRALVAGATNWTGYTHQWRTHPELRDLVMASVDSAAAAAHAHALGWRTFRIRTAEEPIRVGEITCPAADEAGQRTTCARCALCKGTALRAKSITIIQH
jgi:hypothetical protein